MRKKYIINTVVGLILLALASWPGSLVGRLVASGIANFEEPPLWWNSYLTYCLIGLVSSILGLAILYLLFAVVALAQGLGKFITDKIGLAKI